MTIRLMTPGPVPLAASVREALASDSQPHYGEAWVRVWRDVLDRLATLFGTDGDVFNITGSGSAGLDAAIGSLIAPRDRVLVSVNGFHGDRLAQMATAHGADVVRVDAPWGEPVLAEQFEALIQNSEPPNAIFLTHVETTTGVINPVQQIAAVARKYDILVLVDAVASLGGVPFFMDTWGVDVCCSASQKCLGAAAGLAQIAVNNRAWQAMETRSTPGRSWYLDLVRWRDFAQRWRDWHPYPVTVPTHLTLALQAALRLLDEAGIDNRYAYYADLGNYLRSQVHDAGLEVLVNERWAAPVVTAIKTPDGIDSDRLIDELAHRHQIKVGAGFGQLEGRVLRVGHMSPVITRHDLDDLVDAIQQYRHSH